eukprot:Tbor_TRINITY_DN4521_c0_g1::TRINITY_DN4521_c0_g1_i1::g.15774::m.15774
MPSSVTNRISSSTSNAKIDSKNSSVTSPNIVKPLGGQPGSNENTSKESGAAFFGLGTAGALPSPTATPTAQSIPQRDNNANGSSSPASFIVEESAQGKQLRRSSGTTWPLSSDKDADVVVAACGARRASKVGCSSGMASSRNESTSSNQDVLRIELGDKHQNDNLLAAAPGGESGPVTVSFSVELSTSITENCDSKVSNATTAELNALLTRLTDSIQACRDIGVDWDSLLDYTQPQRSAENVKEYVLNANQAVTSVCRHMNTPSHLSIIPYISDDKLRTEVRDLVLKYVLEDLTISGDDPMPNCAAMLAEMVKLELVMLTGIGKTLEAFLNDPSTRRAAIAVLGILAENYSGNEAFLKAVRHLQPILQSFSNDPSFNYDNAFITRIVGWNLPGPQLGLIRRFPIPQNTTKSIVSSTYFSTSDELLTGSMDGTISVWGAPQYGGASLSKTSAGNVNGESDQTLSTSPNTSTTSPGCSGPSAKITLPPSYLPVSMDAFTRGRILAVACVAPAPATPCIRLYQCTTEEHAAASSKGRSSSTTRGSCSTTSAGDDSNSSTNFMGPSLSHLTAALPATPGVWKLVENIERDECSMITCLKRINFKTNTFCTGEADGQSHNIVFFNGQGKQIRQIQKAHTDVITVLNTSQDANWLFSGSRDTTVKAWDSRTGTSPLHILTAHTDTITSINATNDYVITGGIDKKVCLWDIRRLKKPLQVKEFQGPVLKTAVTGASRPCIAVSTTCGLTLLSMGTLSVEDVISNTCYVDLQMNYLSSVMFASGRMSLDAYVTDPNPTLSK